MLNYKKTIIKFMLLTSFCSAHLFAAVNNAGQISNQTPQTSQSITEDTNNNQNRNSRFENAENLLNNKDSANIKPFGSQLFNGGFRGTRSDGKNANYKIAPGDQITLRVWGAISLESILPVDTAGNVFIPSIGPVNIKGLTPQAVDNKIRSSIRAIYPENVEVYTHLQGVQPVAVFVTGYVSNPGRYAGTPNDSVLYFLQQAGGIDNILGSYRQVEIIRNKRRIARIDLYDFLLAGKLSTNQFKDGDTILVKPRKTAVIVTGDVKKPFSYELLGRNPQGSSIIKLARLKAGVSHVLLSGARNDGAKNKYLSIEDFAQQKLKTGDAVIVSADQRSESIVVQIEGNYYGPSRFAVSRDILLKDFLDSIAVPRETTDTKSISIRRVSVAENQRKSLEESLKRLETTYLSAPSSTPEEATIRVQEAELINKFTERARQSIPTGRLVVSMRGEVANIRLKDGDIITIPERSDSILISGEVRVPQSVIFTQGRSANDYIAGAGGFSQQADDDQILVVRKNGEVINSSSVDIIAGDEIIVLPKVPIKNLQLATSISQILYQLAIATKVVIDL